MIRSKNAFFAAILLVLGGCSAQGGGEEGRTPSGRPIALTYPYLTGEEEKWEDREQLAERTAAAYVKLVPLAEASPNEAVGFDRESARVTDDGLQPGSGVVLSADGLILTVAHVARAEGRSVRVILRDGRRLRGRVVAADPDRELALVQTAPIPGARPLPLGRSGSLERDAWTLAVGSPRLAWGVVSVGKVRSANIGERLSDGRWSFENAIEIGMLVETGHSGGPLVDAQKALIGIVAFREQGDTTVQPYRAPRIAYAVPVDDIRRWLRMRGVDLPDPD